MYLGRYMYRVEVVAQEVVSPGCDNILYLRNFSKGKEMVMLTTHESRYERKVEGSSFMRRVVLDHVEKVVREFALMKEQKGWELMN